MPSAIIGELLAGDLDGVLERGDLWQCLDCLTCYERCHSRLGMAEVFQTLKELAQEQGNGARAGAVGLRPVRRARASLGEPREAAREKLGLAALPARRWRGAARHPREAARPRKSVRDERRGRRAQPRDAGRRAATAALRRAAGALGGPGARPDFGPRPRYREESEQRILGGCGLMGVCDQSGARMSGELALRSMASMHDRGNGLGGGFAGYGIYPELPHLFCFHLLYNDDVGQGRHRVLPARSTSVVVMDEPIPTKPIRGIEDEPILWRYFLDIAEERLAETQLSRRGLRGPRGHGHQHPRRRGVRRLLGQEHGRVQGRGLPRGDRGVLPHRRVPGLDLDRPRPLPHQHPGLVGRGASLRPARLLHRAQRRDQLLRHQPSATWRCSATSAPCSTDTEVVTYLFDLMLRRHGLPVEIACKALASPFWKDIDLHARGAAQALHRPARWSTAPALLNGPFAVVLGMDDGMVALNDRIKLRPLVAARRRRRRLRGQRGVGHPRDLPAAGRELDAPGGRAGGGPGQREGPAEGHRPDAAERRAAAGGPASTASRGWL